MSRVLRYLTHPQVQIDPDVPVPEWGLSALGRERTLSICSADILSTTSVIVSSNETKAVETATIIADAIGLEVKCRERMYENDRSATGFLEPAEFEQVANQFFASPEANIRGWERAIDAQERIVLAASQIMKATNKGDILLVGHGGVGTLLYCHLASLPISRLQDQLPGGGCYFAYDVEQSKILHHWKKMEDLNE